MLHGVRGLRFAANFTNGSVQWDAAPGAVQVPIYYYAAKRVRNQGRHGVAGQLMPGRTAQIAITSGAEGLGAIEPSLLPRGKPFAAMAEAELVTIPLL